jgi:predicted enzyme related to lactoylglutathione lyase
LPELQYTNVLTTPVDDQTRQPREPGAINGGMFQREGDLTHPIITVDVDDIDAALERISSLGGSVVQSKTAIPGMGCFVYFRDTEGNVLGLWTTATDAA